MDMIWSKVLKWDTGNEIIYRYETQYMKWETGHEVKYSTWNEIQNMKWDTGYVMRYRTGHEMRYRTCNEKEDMKWNTGHEMKYYRNEMKTRLCFEALHVLTFTFVRAVRATSSKNKYNQI